jgi:hypothetical protein
LIAGLAAGISLGTHLGTNGDDLVMKAQYRTGLIQPAPAKPQTAATPIALKS